jgi:hypothetical protein
VEALPKAVLALKAAALGFDWELQDPARRQVRKSGLYRSRRVGRDPLRCCYCGRRQDLVYQCQTEHSPRQGISASPVERFHPVHGCDAQGNGHEGGSHPPPVEALEHWYVVDQVIHRQEFAWGSSHRACCQ